ncbi:MAG: YCF48-related protein [Bacteroidota bacterium]|nr:YCF48-related protein [Bacteroidota bacterium]
MKKLFTALFITAFTVGLNAQSFNFEWLNPKPHGNELSEIISLDANNIIAFGTAGIVQRSTDGGTTYTLSYPDSSARDFYGAYFWDADKGIACGKAGLLMKTTDKGKSWTYLTSGTTEDLRKVAFVDSDTGYVVGSKGIILKTKDGGKTWVSSTFGTSTIYCISIVKPSLIILGTGNSTTRIIKSTDYGASWTNITTSTVTSSIYSIYYINEKTGMVGTYDCNIYKTIDGGATWVKKTLQSASGAAINDIDFVDSTQGYAVDDKGVIYKTTDGGENWSATKFFQQKFDAITVKYANLYAAGQSGSIYKSTNSGSSWDNKIQAFSQLGFRQLTFVDSKTAYMCGGSTINSDSLGLMYKSTDGAVTWNALDYNFKTNMYSFAMPTADVWYASGGGNSLFKTTDAGKNWTKLTSPVTGVTTMVFYSIVFTSKDTGYAAGNAGKLIKTVDGGQNWTNLTSGFSSTQAIWKIVIPDSSNSNTLFITGGGGKLSKSTDGGQTFTSVDTKVASNFFGLKFKDKKIGLIGGTSQALSKTTDGGNTWTPLTLPSSITGTIWAIGFGEKTYWACLSTGDIIYSTDEGTTWSAIKKFNANPLYDAAFANKSIYFVGASGSVIKGNADLNTSVKQISGATVKSFELTQNYPNPFNPSTTIKYSVPNEGKVSLKVYNLLGEEVATLVNQNQSAGTYSVNFDASSLSSGIYFYQLSSGNNVSVKKMMLVK